MTTPAKSRSRSGPALEPDTAKYRLMDNLMKAADQGGLRRYLRRARTAGRSYAAIAGDLKEITREPITYEAVRQWCQVVCPAAPGVNGSKGR